MSDAPKIAVLYLARYTEGFEDFNRFIASYLRHSAGISHEMVILYKNFTNEVKLSRAEEIFSIPHTPLIVPDTGFDLGSYWIAAKQIEADYICCLNTYSEILSDDWLKKLFGGVVPGKVELVGATGSYESPGRPLYYFARQAKKTGLINKLKLPLRYVKRSIEIILDFKRTYHLLKFPPFPNPHIRTNAFLIRKDLYIDSMPKIPTDKWQALMIESGPDSMTRQNHLKGFFPIVASKNYKYYNIHDWVESRTFRSGEQENLLIGDNRTREFLKSSATEKYRKKVKSWGYKLVT